MPPLDPIAYNFVDQFSVPKDEECHRAGRLGILDLKEDDELSDGDWLALQHREWAEKLRQLHAEIRRLQWALSKAFNLESRNRSNKRKQCAMTFWTTMPATSGIQPQTVSEVMS